MATITKEEADAAIRTALAHQTREHEQQAAHHIQAAKVQAVEEYKKTDVQQMAVQAASTLFRQIESERRAVRPSDDVSKWEVGFQRNMSHVPKFNGKTQNFREFQAEWESWMLAMGYYSD